VTPSPIAPPPIAAETLKIDWQADDPGGLRDVSSIVGVARTNDGYVLVAELPSVESRFVAWWSADGKSWQLAREFPVGQPILALTAGGPGFVVGGADGNDAVVWTSKDGRTWQSVKDASLRDGMINMLVPTASGVVAFGRRSSSDTPAIWTSPDGSDWLAATNETGRRVAGGVEAVGAYDGRAIAVVFEGDDKPAGIWETTGRAEWTRTGSLPTTGTADVVAGGERGWVALSYTDAWTSVDGRSWTTVDGGPDVASDAIADDAGFIAVGYVGSLPGETCGDQRPFAGHTWTSADGRTWQQMPDTDAFGSAFVSRLLVVDRTLVGYGQRIGTSADGLAVGRWTAPLPDVSRPADTSDEASKPEGCGDGP
jgi:hypothetical protein